MTITHVKKNSGRVEKFDKQKLYRSIFNALSHIDMAEVPLAKKLADEAYDMLKDKDEAVIEASEIRDAVLHVMRHHSQKIADAYELGSLHLPEIKIKEVLKLIGKKEKFHPHKIFKSVRRAMTDAGINNEAAKIAEQITFETVERLEKEFGEHPVPVYRIQEVTAEVIRERGLHDVERLYITHKFL